MKLGFLMLVAAALVALIPCRASCLEAYWAALTDKPDLIVVGTLEDRTGGIFTRSYRWRLEQSPSTRYYDIAYVRVDSVLWGEEPDDRVPIYWLARETFDSESDVGWVSDTESFVEGDRKIWVVWLDRRADEIRQPWFHPFQAVEFDHLDKVVGEIEKYLRRE